MARKSAAGGSAGKTRRAAEKSTSKSRSRADGFARTNGRRISPSPKLSRPSGEVQKFGTLRLLPIALSAVARAESAQLLNRLLADTTILYALYKKHHWVVAGPTFYQLHLLFDKHAEEQLDLIDLLAERVQTLGGIAVGDPRHAAELTSIERAPNGAESVADMIGRTLRAHELILEGVRRGIEATEKNGDWGSNDLLMSDVLRRNELQVWFLSEHVVEMPLVEDD
jgi:starvation-inducible DNA-binding protein